MAKLTADQIITAKAWLHDIFVAGGIYPNPKRAVKTDDYANMYGTHPWNKRRLPEICNKAKILCDAIKTRKVDVQLFKNYDTLLEYFSKQYFSTSLDDRYGNTTAKKPAAKKTASKTAKADGTKKASAKTVKTAEPKKTPAKPAKTAEAKKAPAAKATAKTAKTTKSAPKKTAAENKKK